MSLTICRLKMSVVLAALCILSPFWPSASLLAQPTEIPEVGGTPPTSSAEIKIPHLTLPATRLEIGAQYTDLGDDDMQVTYGGVPQLSVGLSTQAATGMRVFASVGYGHGSGDPYADREGFSDPGGATINFVPLQVGVRFDLTTSERVHVNLTAAFELVWARESLPGLVESRPISASGINGGYSLAFGPEWVLGQSHTSVGLDLGWGGTQGDVRENAHRHDVDLTGFQGRLFFAYEL